MTKHVANATELKVFFDGVRPIECKNQGGCLFFCYTFYLWLEKNGYDDSSYSIIQYCADWEDTIPQNEAFVKGAKKEAASANHFTWMYDGKEYDANGLLAKSNDPLPCDWKHHKFDELMKKHFVEKFCINALHNGTWNEMFNRNSAMKTIKDTFGIVIPKSIGIEIDEDTGRVVE